MSTSSISSSSSSSSAQPTQPTAEPETADPFDLRNACIRLWEAHQANSYYPLEPLGIEPMDTVRVARKGPFQIGFPDPRKADHYLPIRDAKSIWNKVVTKHRFQAMQAILNETFQFPLPLVNLCASYAQETTVPVPLLTFHMEQSRIIREYSEHLPPPPPNIQQVPGTILHRFDMGPSRRPWAFPSIPIETRVLIVWVNKDTTTSPSPVYLADNEGRDLFERPNITFQTAHPVATDVHNNPSELDWTQRASSCNQAPYQSDTWHLNIYDPGKVQDGVVPFGRSMRVSGKENISPSKFDEVPNSKWATTSLPSALQIVAFPQIRVDEVTQFQLAGLDVPGEATHVFMHPVHPQLGTHYPPIPKPPHYFDPVNPNVHLPRMGIHPDYFGGITVICMEEGSSEEAMANAYETQLKSFQPTATSNESASARTERDPK